jgi:hypothetical protein
MNTMEWLAAAKVFLCARFAAGAGPRNGPRLDAIPEKTITMWPENKFYILYCIFSNLCYGVYIPVMEVILQAGSSLRHWPPGTSSSTVRAVFFFWAHSLQIQTQTAALTAAECIFAAATALRHARS